MSSAVVPYLRRSGIPVSLVAATAGDERIQFDLRSGATMRDALQEIERKLPEYRYGTIDGRIVIYPRGEVYDSPIDLGQPKSMTRAAAYFSVLRALREKTKAFEKLNVGLSGGGAGWGKRPLADVIEVGGSRSLIGHLVSLVQKRPSESFDVAAAPDGRLHFSFVRVILVTGLELHMPSSVKVGEAFQVEVAGKLIDGTVVSLVGLECWVAYATSDPEALEIDDSGRAVARKKGVWTVYANYQHVPDVHADVRVE